ncbi:endonuclease domain-containing protein [Solirubrum puertoriconensis]|uniref:Cytosine methyltransferase n=1 Tax=Solirubrum puertoriconensis TaxID=1751427 RepID=A0A9X0HM78_SOLP1|nr:DUF559 domain-containing protein [Solirubrum puertoriconensis]KUG08593.1 cytosine methyltransferase [Solirubrum puertoriconensis]
MATEHLHNLPHRKQHRRDLRNNATPAEATLWRCLRNSQLRGRKFRRQHSIGPYIVDFYCPAEQLVVELDGAGHFTVSGEAHDVARTAYLQGLGLRVLRFENATVMHQVENVLAAIEAVFVSNEHQPPLAHAAPGAEFI